MHAVRFSYLLACALPALLAGHAFAQSRSLSATGDILSIDSPCAKSVKITPNPTLSGRVEVQATADHPEELAQINLASGSTIELFGPEHCYGAQVGAHGCVGAAVSRRCWHEADGDENQFRPTLVINIQVPPHMKLEIDESRPASYDVGDIAGAMQLDFSGPVDMTAVSAADVKADLSGPSKVSFTRANGDLDFDVSGPGTLEIGEATGTLAADFSGVGKVRVDKGKLAKVKLDSSGKGEFRFGSVDIGDLSVEASGVSKMQSEGTVHDADLDISGMGYINLAHLTGHLHKDISGFGKIVVNGNEVKTREDGDGGDND